MQKAAADYEGTIRRTAPHRLMQNAFCDETVGRYCVVYDAGTTAATPEEPAAVKEARNKVITAYQAAVDASPSDSTLVAPLIRYLVEDGRATEAVALARAHLDTSPDPAWARMLLGFALHGAGDDVEAESMFARTLPGMVPNERAAMLDVISLLAREEQPRYRALSGVERARYLEQLWRAADPLYLTDGNESLVEHVSRQIYSRIMAYAPPVSGAGWGRDDAELTIRFGRPTGHSQNYGQGVGGRRHTQHYPPNQLTYVPPAMLGRNGPAPFEPGSAWPYDTIRSRSGYAPATVRRMLVLEHQVTRFPSPTGGELRADYVLPADSAVALPAQYAVALFALDSALNVIAEQRATVNVNGANQPGTIHMPLPPGMAAYSLEVIDPASKLAARARYRLPTRSAARPLISDVVILNATEETPPDGRTSAGFQPFASLVLPRGQEIALYLEARNLAADAGRQVRYRVDLEVLEQSSPGTFSRAVRRLGRALGLANDDVAPRITWNEQQDAAETTVIALRLGRIELEPGLKQFRLTVTDQQTGASATTERLVRIR